MNTPYSSLFYIYCWSGKSSAADLCLLPWLAMTSDNHAPANERLDGFFGGRWVGAGWAEAKWDDTQPVTWASGDYHPVVSHMAGQSAGKFPRFLGKSSNFELNVGISRPRFITRGYWGLIPEAQRFWWLMKEKTCHFQIFSGLMTCDIDKFIVWQWR